ncbi:hypothetical protein [Nocardia terpenica]|uniref:Uncharacterized protein n=1 Tax=Nocardia terpenica TaxID=455432 RepID=A0A291RPV6_9NOCA|nr:hypothetical protein [Nocardia terpenica]ATL69329.1 hypothetical protein CRH09_27270 [Nocardia terpenica]
MTDLYRFVALRAPERRLPDESIDLRTETRFQEALADIHLGDGKSAPSPLDSARTIADTYVTGGYGPGFIGDRDQIPDQPAFDRFAESVRTAADANDVSTAILRAFQATAQELVAAGWFVALYNHARDTIVARIIRPEARSYPIADLARLIRLMTLIIRVADDATTLDSASAVAAALNSVLLLPTPAFPLRTDLPVPVGVGDLLVVKQQLIRYEPGDVAKIENILRGEKRSKINRHDLTTDTTTITETSKVTETTTSLDVTERFELKSEVSNVIKEDLAVNAGLSVSAKYGVVEVNANANVAYGLSKEQSTKTASDHAKDVTTRAATKVTETIRREEIARTIEKLIEREENTFDNTTGQTNVSGVYQWVNKVYRAQVFNYGKRLLFDVTVPEPAAFVLDALGAQTATQSPIPPEPFDLVRKSLVDFWRPITPPDLGPDGTLKPGLLTRPVTPDDLDPDPKGGLYYGIFMGKYGAAGVNAPPEPTTTVSKGLSATQDDKHRLVASDDLTIPQGYQANEIQVTGGFVVQDGDTIDGNEILLVTVGKKVFQARGKGDLDPGVISMSYANASIDEQGTIPIAVETFEARDFAVTVDVTCKRTDAWLDQWRMDTFTALLNAHADLVGKYEDKVKAQQIKTAGTVALGDNPTLNRLIERAELKKSCLALLSGTDLYAAGFDDIAVETSGPLFPRPNIPPLANAKVTGGDQEAFIRFFEQVFEWEHMQYLFYPYYWGRSKTWYDKAIADNPDPLFAEFLKSGAARVVIPVRPQLEGDLRYFLMTGQIWGGGAMPEITDGDYLPITREIQDRDDAPGTETPQGPPWEVVLPTTLVQLRGDDTLPSWRQFTYEGRDVWVPGRTVADGTWQPDYGHLDDNGNWSPQ